MEIESFITDKKVTIAPNTHGDLYSMAIWIDDKEVGFTNWVEVKPVNDKLQVIYEVYKDRS